MAVVCASGRGGKEKAKAGGRAERPALAFAPRRAALAVHGSWVAGCPWPTNGALAGGRPTGGTRRLSCGPLSLCSVVNDKGDKAMRFGLSAALHPLALFCAAFGGSEEKKRRPKCCVALFARILCFQGGQLDAVFNEARVCGVEAFCECACVEEKTEREDKEETRLCVKVCV